MNTELSGLGTRPILTADCCPSQLPVTAILRECGERTVPAGPVRQGEPGTWHTHTSVVRELKTCRPGRYVSVCNAGRQPWREGDNLPVLSADDPATASIVRYGTARQDRFGTVQMQGRACTWETGNRLNWLRPGRYRRREGGSEGRQRGNRSGPGLPPSLHPVGPAEVSRSRNSGQTVDNIQENL
jgi:hypothetical protein